MPSAADFQSEATALGLVSKYVVIVNESLGALAPSPAPGTRDNLDAATYRLHFDVSTVNGTRTLVCVNVYTAAKGGTLPLYFLPWYQNAATLMTIPAGGAGPGIFMTSMLSGCSVQVHGTAANPTITHANASDKYNGAYGQQEKVLKSFVSNITPQQTHDFSEARANSVATGAIDNMLPPGLGLTRTVRKSDYAGKLNPANLQSAQRRFIGTLPASQSLGDFGVQKMKLKPKTGAFVFGLRDATHRWAFYYQAEVDVEMVVQDKFGGTADQQLTMESVVLGAPERFFP